MGGFREGKREGIEALGGAEPHVAAAAQVDVGAEGLGEALTQTALDAVGHDHQIGALLGHEGLELIGGEFVLKAQHDPQVAAALLQHGEQALATDTAEAVSARAHGTPREADVDIVPAVQGRGNDGAALRIGRTQIGDGLVGEDDAPAERIVGAIALDDRDLRARVAPLHEQRGIEPAGTSTYHHNVHRIHSMKGRPSTLRPITSNIK